MGKNEPGSGLVSSRRMSLVILNSHGRMEHGVSFFENSELVKLPLVSSSSMD